MGCSSVKEVKDYHIANCACETDLCNTVTFLPNSKTTTTPTNPSGEVTTVRSTISPNKHPTNSAGSLQTPLIAFTSIFVVNFFLFVRQTVNVALLLL